MTNLRELIEALEKRAGESRLIADLATDEETKTYNTSLSKKLRSIARQMRSQREALGLKWILASKGTKSTAAH